MDFWLRSAGCGIANAGKIIHDSLDGFGQNAGIALDAWGKHVGKDLDPNHPIHIAMTKTGEFSFGTARQTLRFLDHLGQHTEKSVSGAYNHAHHQLAQVDWDTLAQEVRRQIESSAKELGIAVSVAATHVFRIAESELPDAIKHWIAENPGQTVFIVAAGVVFFAPFLIRVPVLRSLGFAARGVDAGSAAAAIQSIIGPVMAGSIFSLLQSAGAGGAAGVAVVNQAVVTAAGVGAGVVAATCAKPNFGLSPEAESHV
ncbi:hypothetical protein FB567DRAFT_600567 [Paraphoma chrysanthemicola]|uniref:Uncharacterized protein n=1 Tax=Paraphoma chrysanthemicola TaxID=798071 RepID=A0A8K0RH65_9PLEO|nr:hypothetical protein FB567DRAFT_600567 [Paraphoma chrysanthemicola]